MKFFSPDEGYLQQIKNLCAVCFDMEIEEVNYVFEQGYISTDICYAIEDEEKICCMLFTVPCDITIDGEKKKGHYIYGACTLPEYRHRGLMHRLIDYANKQTAEKGDEFSALLPANRGLYDFYSDMGYRTLFVAQNKLISKDELPDLHSDVVYQNDISITEMDRLRDKLCSKYTGSVIYSKEILSYAVSYAKECRGGAVQCDDGYIIYAYDDDKLIVIELMCDIERLATMLGILKELCTAKHIMLRLPPWLSDDCDSFGMVKILRDIDTAEFNNAYLGLTFD
jgi:predicted acetyltransferase